MSVSKTAEVIPFNPLDKKNLGASVAEALVSQPAHALGDLKSFFGSGIYAIYYHGQHVAYGPIATPNRVEVANPTLPIYVGKAVPQGARKGKSCRTPRAPRPFSAGSKSMPNRFKQQPRSTSRTFLAVTWLWMKFGFRWANP